MCDRYPDVFSSYDYHKLATGRDDWNSYDEDPFQPLPVLGKKGAQAPYQLPTSEGAILSDDDINFMLPLLLNNQDQDIANDSGIVKKNESHSAAPKNVRSGRPAKRPLDGCSAFVRNERTQMILSQNHGAEPHEAEDYLSTLNKKIKVFNSVAQQDDGELMKLYSKNQAAPETDLSYMKAGFIPLAKKSTPTADPLLYEVLQTYRTVEHLSTESSAEPAQPDRHRKYLDFPPLRWHWHHSSKPLCIPPPEFVSVKDLNGTPQAFKIVYAAITLPYDMANKVDPVVLYKSTKSTIESLINNNKLNIGG